ncbi:MAG: dicarboxylate/amino acid:cation symporter, partial [Gemmataceae bacterium]|nr:dicarboxylate/amino acid:cation symporter [Gemmataceae bacterium]
MSSVSAKGGSLHNLILGALVLGAIMGVTANALAPPDGTAYRLLHGVIRYVLEPVGKVFLRLLFLTIVPLVFSSLALGVSRLGAQGNLGRIGLKTFAFFVASMTIAVALGLSLVAIVQPGAGLPEATKEQLNERYRERAAEKASQETQFGIDTLINIVPTNPIEAMARMDMLAVIFTAMLFGIALNQLETEKARTLTKVLEGVNDVMIVVIGWAMRLAPLGVFGLVFATTANFGWQLLQLLGWYVVVVIVGLAVQMFGVLSVFLVVVARVSPTAFFG